MRAPVNELIFDALPSKKRASLTSTEAEKKWQWESRRTLCFQLWAWRKTSVWIAAEGSEKYPFWGLEIHVKPSKSHCSF